MVQGLEADLKQIVLTSGPFGPQEIKKLEQAIAEDFSQFRALRDAVGELEDGGDQSPAAAVRLGVCYYLLGRYQVAAETLKSGDGGALSNFYLGKTNVALGNYALALQNYAAAAKAGYNSDDCVLARAEATAPQRRSARRPGPVGRPVRRGRANGRIPLPTGYLRGGHRR